MTYTYKNRKTGAVISVPCHLAGTDWEQITEAEKPEEKTEAPKAPAKKKPAAKKGADADG